MLCDPFGLFVFYAGNFLYGKFLCGKIGRFGIFDWQVVEITQRRNGDKKAIPVPTSNIPNVPILGADREILTYQKGGYYGKFKF